MSLINDLLIKSFNPIAPSPDGNGNFLQLSVSYSRIQELAKSGRTSDIFAFLYNLCGQKIPVNMFGYHEAKEGQQFPDNWGGLKHSHLLFRGINRPYKDAERDFDVYIYVVKHKYVYKYEPSMVCVAKRLEAPKNSLFVAYVVFENNDFSKGTIQNWEWIKADPESPNYPKDWLTRYKEKVWENE